MIERARLLFAPTAAPPAGGAAAGLAAAAWATAATADITGHNSGLLVAHHKTFARNNTATLSEAGHTEAVLDTHLARGAALTHTGGRRLDAIAAETRATTRAAATVSTPAGERAILLALRSQLSRANDVVTATTAQASGLAGQIRGLTYPVDRPDPAVPDDLHAVQEGVGSDPPVAPSLFEPPFPAGPIVWCVRPQGTFGFWRCSVLYPDLSVGTYWSPSDDTGGSLP
ncbi:DUF4226 domain-containing protein [Mycobacterium lehmannii]|uniref:DUF4226 domain-containing protein n=1 Tax=Mycobacterium lehmannii TaxID=2048550 RepID=UPI0013044924|nr:DUF4226 domain-containing protein [Mycobacterium lehmannii]